jgi:hypothetical protein
VHVAVVARHDAADAVDEAIYRGAGAGSVVGSRCIAGVSKI